MVNVQARERVFSDLVTQNFPDPSDAALIRDAMAFASEKHAGQTRKSNDPFIIHPLETAIKLIEWKMDAATVCAGLLHDVLEDTEVTEAELEGRFGPEVCLLVRLVTKISLIAKKNRERGQSHNLTPDYQIQVFMSISKDIRAIVVKLADRFHNLGTIQYLPPERQKAIAQETFDIYANIAGRLGMYNVKTQLLDQAFQIIDYDAYANTVSIINQYRLVNGERWKRITDKIRHLLADENVNYEFEDRIKGVYSTYRKLSSISRINNIHDVYALRVILDNELDVYHVLGLIHLNFKYIPKFFKDYVSAPKNNLYQSVHTTIIDEKTLVEIQIRTKWMDANSKLGLASHWRYKEESKAALTHEASKLFQLDLFLDASDKNARLVKELTKIPIVDVIVTNNQNTYSVPVSSTVLDLAYQVDPEQFKSIEDIFRFGEKIPWSVNPENGDVIEITYAKQPTIRESWARYVSNPAVRKHIAQTVSNLEISQYSSVQAFADEVARTLKDRQISPAEMPKRLRILGLRSLKEYLEFINALHLPKSEQIAFFSKGNEWKAALRQIRRNSNRWIFSQSFFETVEGLKITAIQIPRCCSKLPYTQVVGVKERSALHAHNPTCKALAKSSAADKLIPLRWNKKKLETSPRKFRAQVEIRGAWSESVVNTIALNVVKNQGSLHEIGVAKNKQTREFAATVTLYVYDMGHLERIMGELILRNINFE